MKLKSIANILFNASQASCKPSALFNAEHFCLDYFVITGVNIVQLAFITKRFCLGAKLTKSLTNRSVVLRIWCTGFRRCDLNKNVQIFL